MSSFLFLCSSSLLIIIIQITSSSTDAQQGIPDACTSCAGMINGTETWAFCESDSQLHVMGRCCMNATEVVGLDLHNCSLTENSFLSAVKDLTYLQYLSVELNPIHELTEEDLKEQTDLIYLSLPPTIPCPGGAEAWRVVAKKPKNMNVCKDLLDPCVSRNITCPEKSHCVHSSFDSFECHCDEGFHGYKCMNEGEFPMTPFIIGLTVPTVLLSIFIYITQRRHVVKKEK